MREAGVGRVLVASLHQAIADVLPTRLGFYEHWLHAEGLRDGRIGTAAVMAVLSFLRQEGEAYDEIVSRAGAYSASWTIESMPGWKRSTIRIAPAFARNRLLLGTARQLVHATFGETKATTRVRGGVAKITLAASIFCAVREPVSHPLCRFYAAAFTKLLQEFGVEVETEVVACRGTGAPSCVMSIPF